MKIQWMAVGLVASFFSVFCGEVALGAPLETAGTGYWTNPATWNPAQVPTVNDDVTILAGHTVTIATNVSLPVNSLTIRTNAVLTHLANGTTAQGERYKVILNITGSLTIDLGGKINADIKGYAKGNGLGFGPGYGNGGSHGGKGGYYAGLAPGLTYGSITSPTNLGSGGGAGGFIGGGAVQLTVGGASTVNGIISALGQDGGGGGGAGGSVFLTTDTLTGTGSIRVNGGGGSIRGGGGRVAVILTGSTDFGNVALQAYAGGIGAAGGTVYQQHTGHLPGNGRLIVDYNDIATYILTATSKVDVVTLQNGVGASSYEFSEIVLTNGAVYALDTNDTLNISSSIIYADSSDRNEGFYVDGGTLTVPTPFGFTNYFIGIGRTNATFNPGVSLTVGTNATMKFDVPWTVNYPITLEGGGWLSHSGNTTNEANRLNLTVNGNLDIRTNSQINVDGMGYARGQGPGSAPTAHGTAGSHGGRGGVYSSTPARLTYGSITSPMNCGSGGGVGYVSEGGGAVWLTVNGTTTVNGAISALGLNVGEGGGAGGSIFLTTGTLMGNGSLRANGGTGSPRGGGGRIAVILTNDTVFGNITMQAYAGGINAAGGTIYQEHTGHLPGQGKLTVDYNDQLVADFFTINTMQNGYAPSSQAFSEIMLTNGAVYALDTNDTLNIVGTTINGDPTDRNEGIYVAGGTLTVPSAFGFANYYIAIGSSNAAFLPADSLSVGTNATMKFDVPWTVNYPITLESGGWLSHSPNTANEACKLNLIINASLNIMAGGQVNVDGMGYAASKGPDSFVTAFGTGGSHGGRGAPYGAAAGDSSRTTYGSITAPTNCGSGGGQFGSGYSGGGAARLTISGTTTLNGAISALGVTGGQGGGAGGSVFLTTASLTGSGAIRANGGGGTIGGGGGRIAVVLTNDSVFGNVTMQAIGGGTIVSAAGTIYSETASQGSGNGTVLIDASNLLASAAISTLISSNVTGTVVGTVIITNKAILALNTNQSLTVNGSWTNAGSFIAATNSTVILAGTDAATVMGSNSFYNLAITNAGKTVSFQAGKTNIVNGLLSLGTTTPGSTVTLKSTADGSWSYLTLTAGGTQQIARVTVKDSNAGGGQTLLAGKGSVDGGHNVYWDFPKIGGTVIWLH